MEFKYPRNFDFKSYAFNSLHFMEWYLDQKEISDDNKIHRNILRLEEWKPNKEDNYIPLTTADLDSWDFNLAYICGDVVTYKNHIYEAKWWTLGDTPSMNVQYHWDTPWQIIQ
ncbi:carbohydrate-binding protein [Oceanirhabdus seepicola]|uniref:Chitin-binding type-3 domain-containing protein n=1 Tax=Oceanirhabdus seepicola TaxID=2828781 RepID=A0A9J6NUL8_9CLOT|nr:carbohydrate-binding protein [Oceanirhabdus seepicola]MCM1988159.1 hypothetical protein [Oceanirhabdus seepicola]